MNHLEGASNTRRGVLSVLAKWPADQRFYRVKVLHSNRPERKCFVKFEDDLECWMSANDLHLQLSLLKVDDNNIVCCVCDGGLSEAPNEMIMCDFCQQGYHVKCHQPEIDRDQVHLDDEDKEWNCATCKYIYQLDTTGLVPASEQSEEKLNGTSSTMEDEENKDRENCELDNINLISESSKIAAPKIELIVEKINETKAAKISEMKTEKREHTADDDTPEVTTATSKRRRPKTDPKAKLERMDKGLINAALALADTQNNVVGTASFVEVVTSMDDGVKIGDMLSELTKPTNSAAAPKARRTNKTPSAAA